MTAAAARPIATNFRRAMLAKIHMAAGELGLREEDRRDVLERLTGCRSSADCTNAQLDEVLAEFRRLGWRPKTAVKADKPTNPVALKARAMWTSLWNLGAVRSNNQRALEAFAKRQLKVDSLRWADQGQGFRLIEALKAMAEREGWSQDLTGVREERHIWSLKARLVQRQAEILGREPFRLHDLSLRDLDRLADENGPAVRTAKAAP